MGSGQLRVAILALLVCLTMSHGGVRHDLDHKVNLPTKKPLNIAHRGACGVLPEHTVEGFQKGIEDGADLLECDVCVTKDLKLVCLHESWMTDYTDVASKFPPSRMQTYFIPEMAKNITDYYTVDFTLAEIKTLGIKQRFSFRDQSYGFKLQIATVDEALDAIKNAGRPVGFYPEVKDPEWVNSVDVVKKSGKTFEQLLVERLEHYGFSESTDPCFIQSFSIDSLRRLEKITKLPLVMLMWRGNISVSDLDNWTDFYGIGPWKDQLIHRYENNTLAVPNNIVKEAHARGLKVHTYTFRNENQYLANEYGQDPYLEYEQFVELGIDGFFTDFPHSFSNYLENMYQKKTSPKPCTNGASALNGLQLSLLSFMALCML